MPYTVKTIDAGHMWSKHMYNQYYIETPAGQSVDTRTGDVRRFDKKESAQAVCDKLNKK